MLDGGNAKSGLPQQMLRVSESAMGDNILRQEQTKKKKKRKLVKKRKSLMETKGVGTSPPSGSDFSIKNQEKSEEKPKTPLKTFSLPKIKIRRSRLDELSMPSGRSLHHLLSLAISSTENRKKLPLLTAIKPENEKSEKERFMRAGFTYNPLFLYPCPADQESMERFTTPSDRYLNIAVQIMERAIERFGTYKDFEEQTGGRVLTRPEIISLVQKYLKLESLEEEIEVNLREDLLARGSIMHTKGRTQLNVRVVNLRENWCKGLLRHELGTHYLRSTNNRQQPWGLWKERQELCLQHHNPTEEGLASLHSVLFREQPFLWRAALLYYVAFKAAHLSFKNLFMDLGRFVQNPDVRWDYCVRAKRGQSDTSLPGTFCKDQVYLEGSLQLLKRRDRLDFPLLMRLGKVAHGDLERLMEHGQLEGTRIPSFMNNLSEYCKQLNHIAETNGLTHELLNRVE